MLQKTFLPASFLAVPLALGLALAGAPDRAAASTITGSVVLDLNATVQGVLDGSILSGILIGGSFGTRNTLSCYECDDQWTVFSTVEYGPSTTGVSGTSTATAGNGAMQQWNKVRTTPADTVSLFSVVSFFDSIIVTALQAGGNASGMRNIGLSSVDWTVTGAQIGTNDPLTLITTSGSFTMEIGAGDLADFVGLFGGFDGIADDMAGLLSGAAQPVSATLVATPGSSAAVIPVPASLPLLAGGLGVFGLVAWRRRSRAA